MTSFQEGTTIFVIETEKKPNLYAANVIMGVMAVVATVCLLNDIGVFEVNPLLVHICLVMTLVLFIITQSIVRNEERVINPISKYIIMGMVLLYVLILGVLLNIHAVLAFILPVLLATQYRSRYISAMALVGSVICCGISPVLSYLLDTWSLLFLTGYIETFCRVTLNVVMRSPVNALDDIYKIILYWALPQMLTLSAFGGFLFSVTKNGIQSVNNQIQVVNLGNDLSKQLESISTMQEKLLFTMSDIIESRDLETGGHVRRTSEVVRLLAAAMREDPSINVSNTFYHNIINAAPLHDLGKISIPDAILRKPDRLTVQEYEVVKQHPVISARIINQALTGVEDSELVKTAMNIALYHHERVDGKGYPEGLKGKQIPLEARIMAIADVYDALVSERAYKAPVAFDQAFNIIQECMGTQFDADLNKYFLQCRKEIENYYSPEGK